MSGGAAATGGVGSTKGYFDRFAGEGTAIGRIRTHSAVKKTKKIVSNPGNIKKACQITYKSIGVYNVMHKVILHPELVKGLKGIVDVIDFYGSYKNIVFWIKTISAKPLLNRDRFEESLNETLENEGGVHDLDERSRIVNAVMASVFQPETNLNDEATIRKLVKKSLKEERFNTNLAKTMANEKVEVVFEKQSRPVPELVLVFCFTVGDLIDNVVTLKKYGIFDYTVLTAKIAA
jgi:hypothetical protein